jgi:hypothetical protein
MWKDQYERAIFPDIDKEYVNFDSLTNNGTTSSCELIISFLSILHNLIWDGKVTHECGVKKYIVLHAIWYASFTEHEIPRYLSILFGNAPEQKETRLYVG